MTRYDWISILLLLAVTAVWSIACLWLATLLPWPLWVTTAWFAAAMVAVGEAQRCWEVVWLVIKVGVRSAYCAFRFPR